MNKANSWPNPLLPILVAFAFTFAPRPADAAAILDSSIITVTSSGSLNTIVGFGSVDAPLSLPGGSVLAYFEVEFIAFSVSPTVGLPNSHSLEFRYLSPFSTGNLAFSFGTFIGQTVVASPSENAAAYQKLLAFVDDSELPQPQIMSTLAWSSGGVNAASTSQFEVRAIGELTAVPEPSSVVLLCAGAAFLSLARLGRPFTSEPRKRSVKGCGPTSACT
jgi:hypothetical protein